MLPLHDRTRRMLAIFAFLVLGLGPIFVLAYMGIERRLPSYVRHEESKLTQLLGVSVSIDRIEHPKPGTIVYRELRDDDIRCRCRGAFELALAGALFREAGLHYGIVGELTEDRCRLPGK